MNNDYGQKPGLAPLYELVIDDDHTMFYGAKSNSWILKNSVEPFKAEIKANAFKTIAEFRTWAESKL